MRSDGALWELLHMPGGGSINPPSKESLKKKMHYLKMKGNETFKVAGKDTGKILWQEPLKKISSRLPSFPFFNTASGKS